MRAKKSSSPARRVREDGQQSRQAILKAAVQLATTIGLRDLSIGTLAEHTGMSKSGLFGLFGSKEDLELATVEAALGIFTSRVIEPALKTPPGRDRLLAVGDAYLKHLKEKVFLGGCFFASVAAEVDTTPGRVRTRILAIVDMWLKLLEQCAREAQEAGELDPSADPAQIAFEADAMLSMGNTLFVLRADAAALDRASRGFRAVVQRFSKKSR